MLRVMNEADLEASAVASLYDIPIQRLDGTTTTLAEWRGQVLLIVNVASACGFTPQYAGLEALWRRHRDRGLVVLGFPCNQFAGQEPGSAAEIREFCSTRYDVTFPLFAKMDVNGDAGHPVYRHLKSRAPGVLGTEAIKWNFTKFVVDRAGNVVERFAPATTPEALESQLDRWL